jgi:hypothetical protein
MPVGKARLVTSTAPKRDRAGKPVIPPSGLAEVSEAVLAARNWCEIHSIDATTSDLLHMAGLVLARSARR